MWRCFVSVSEMIWGGDCVASMFCKSRIVVCIPLVLKVRAVIGGWEYSCIVLGSVSLGGCGGDVWLCGCVWGVGEGGSFGFLVSCVVCALVVEFGEGPGRAHPLIWLMCNCVLLCPLCLLGRLRGCFLLVGLGMGGLRVCRRGGVLFVSWEFVLLVRVCGRRSFMRLGLVVVFASLSGWVSLCGRLLEMEVVGVMSLG